MFIIGGSGGGPEAELIRQQANNFDKRRLEFLKAESYATGLESDGNELFAIMYSNVMPEIKRILRGAGVMGGIGFMTINNSEIGNAEQTMYAMAASILYAEEFSIFMNWWGIQIQPKPQSEIDRIVTVLAGAALLYTGYLALTPAATTGAAIEGGQVAGVTLLDSAPAAAGTIGLEGASTAGIVGLAPTVAPLASLGAVAELSLSAQAIQAALSIGETAIKSGLSAGATNIVKNALGNNGQPDSIVNALPVPNLTNGQSPAEKSPIDQLLEIPAIQFITKNSDSILVMIAAVGIGLLS